MYLQCCNEKQKEYNKILFSLNLDLDGDIYFKMRMIFPRWHLYQVKSEKIAEESAKRLEDSTDLLKNFKKGLENSK